MAVTALDPTARQGIIDEAARRAATNGTSSQQELYNYAKSNNIAMNDVDTYMGWNAGTSDSWAKQNVAGYQSSNTQPAATAAPATPTYNANQQSVINEAQRRAKANGTTAQQEAWNYAAGNGMKPVEVDNFFGWNPGTTENWAKTNVPNYQSNANAGTPVPASVTTTPAAPNVTVAPTVGADNSTRTGGIVANAAPLATQTTTPWNVTPNQTVQGQLESILNPNSSLMQQARTTALQNANDRGLVNSSMAETGALDSMMRTGLPIAQQDAQTNANAAQLNANNLTTFARDNNLNLNDINKLGLSNSFDLNKMAVQQGYDLTKLNQNQINTLAQMSTANGYDLGKLAIAQGYDLQKMATQQGYDLSKMSQTQVNALALSDSNFRNQLALQGSAGTESRSLGFQTGAANIMTTLSSQIAQINQNANFTGEAGAAAKSEMISYQKEAARTAIQVLSHASGDIDVSNWLDQIFAA